MENEKKLYPFRFVPQDEGQSRVQVADLGYIDSEISNGWLAADSIGDIMDTYMDRVVGDDVFAWYGRQFPLQVRTIRLEGSEPLTVSPDDVTAGQRYDFLGKCRLRYVVSAAPGATLSIGFRRPVSAAELYDACLGDNAAPLLNTFAPVPGEAYLIPPGSVFSAQGPLTMVEISQCSPLDFRLTAAPSMEDQQETAWSGASPDNPPLTLAEALDFIDLQAYKAPERASGGAGRILADTEQLRVSEISLSDPLQITSGDSFSLYSCVNGAADIQYRDESGATCSVPVGAGETVLVPAELESFYLVPREARTLLLESLAPARAASDGYAPMEDDATDSPDDIEYAH